MTTMPDSHSERSSLAGAADPAAGELGEAGLANDREVDQVRQTENGHDQG